MAQPIQIAEFFARIGFKADTKVLELMLFQMKQLARTARDLRSATKNSFNFRTDSKGIDQARVRIGATISEVRKLRTEIGLIRGANVNVNANVNRRGMGGGGGGGGGGSQGGGRLSMFDGGLGAGAMIRAGIAPVAATVIGTDIVKTSMKVDAAKAALLSVTGTAEEAATEFKWLREEADRIGFTFLDNTRTFTNFLAASKSVGVGTEETKEIFQSTAEYGRVLGLSNDDLMGTFRALQQMMSKGTVQSEELKGQLGERLPGAVGLAADALGVTTEQLFKMLENGEVLAKNLLPKLAREFKRAAHTGGAFAKAQKSTAAELARFENQWNDLQDAFARSGFLVAVTKGIDFLGEAMTKLSPLILGIGESLGVISEFLEMFFNPIVLTTTLLIGGWALANSLLASSFIAATLAALPFFGMFLIFVGPTLLAVAALVSLFAVIEDLSVALNGGDSQFKKWADGGSKSAQAMISLAKGIQTVIDRTLEYWNLKDPRKKNPIAGDGSVGIGGVFGFGTGGEGVVNLLDIAAGSDMTSKIPMMSAQQGYGISNNVWNNLSPVINITTTATDKKEVAEAVRQSMTDLISSTSLDLPVSK